MTEPHVLSKGDLPKVRVYFMDLYVCFSLDSSAFGVELFTLLNVHVH